MLRIDWEIGENHSPRLRWIRLHAVEEYKDSFYEGGRNTVWDIYETEKWSRMRPLSVIDNARNVIYFQSQIT